MTSQGVPAPLLNDAAEVSMMFPGADQAAGRMTSAGQDPGAPALKLPVQRPNVSVPVVELFLTTAPTTERD